MTYTLYYVKQDDDPNEMGPDDGWSVYSEQYESISDTHPIEGSTVMVSGNHRTEMSAREEADARQRRSYSENRKAQADG